MIKLKNKSLKEKNRYEAIKNFYVVSKMFRDDTLMTAVSLKAVGAKQKSWFMLRDLSNLWVVKYKEELSTISKLSDEKKEDLFWFVKEIIIKSEEDKKSPFSLFKSGEFLK